MLKKMIATAMAGATMLSVAGVAMAKMPWPMFEPSEVEVENEHMFVLTKTEADASSGWNDQFATAMWGGDVTQRMTTGTASGTAFSGVMAGYTLFPSCNCFDGDVEVENEHFKVMTFTDASAKTGGNDQVGMAMKWKSDAFQSLSSGNATAKGESQVIAGYTEWQVWEPK